MSIINGSTSFNAIEDFVLGQVAAFITASGNEPEADVDEYLESASDDEILEEILRSWPVAANGYVINHDDILAAIASFRASR